MKYTHAFFAGFLVLVLLGAGCSSAVVEEVEEVANEVVEEVAEELNEEMNEEEEELEDGIYALNPETSVIDWTATYLVGTERLGTVEAQEGSVTVEDEELEATEITIDMTSIEAELGEKLSDHLKNSDFFEVETYPTATFTMTGDEVIVADGEHTVIGTFTIKGITHEQEVMMALSMEDEDTVRAMGTVVLDRSIFGIEFGSTSFFSLEELGDKGIKDEFVLDLNLAFDRQ